MAYRDNPNNWTRDSADFIQPGSPGSVDHLREGPVTNQGSSGPGYYQTRGAGLKSGRTSPRQQVRGSARDQTLAAHGLIDKGAADPNQGQLFDPGPRRSDQQVIADTGRNMPTGIDVVGSNGKTSTKQFGAAPGFMPNLNTKQKMSALQSVEEGRVKSGTSYTGNPLKDTMTDRAATRAQAPDQPWYTGTSRSGSNDASITGHAQAAIQARAERQGVSGASMTRAAALTSPQSAWDRGVPGSPDYSMPNLNHAEQVVKATEIASPYVDRKEAMEIGSEIPTRDGGLPTMGAKAAGVHYDNGNDVTSNIQVGNVKSLKAPNFEASLRSSGEGNGSGSRAVQRMASQSYTVDRHDAKAAGQTAGKVLEDRVGAYDALAMTGARTAFKNRTLPPNEQAREWVGQRGHNQSEGEHQGMMETGLTAGKVVPKTDLVQHTANTSRASRRKMGTAERMGIEF